MADIFDPSKPLGNARHEKMAQSIVSGASLADAHETAGFKRNDGNAWKLYNGNEVLRLRIAWLKDQAANDAKIDAAWVLEQLKINALEYRKDNPVASNRAFDLILLHLRETEKLKAGPHVGKPAEGAAANGSQEPIPGTDHWHEELETELTKGGDPPLLLN